MATTRHPQDPPSNVNKFGAYDPNKYIIDNVSLTVKVHEDLIPNRPPCLTQMSIGKFLQPLTRELVEDPPKPTVDELSDAVIENMVMRDKAFWVDKPGVNDYVIHDAYRDYEMTSVLVKPPHQDVFPRSYQYDLDCVKYRRTHACAGLKQPADQRTAWATDPGQKRWKYYPDLSATLSHEEVKKLMIDVGRPYKNEAINWYYKNYPPKKYNTITRKCSK